MNIFDLFKGHSDDISKSLTSASCGGKLKIAIKIIIHVLHAFERDQATRIRPYRKTKISMDKLRGYQNMNGWSKIKECRRRRRI